MRACRRSRNSSTIDGGNFGAPPKPPLTSSYVVRSEAAASSSTAASSGAGASSRGAASALTIRWPVSRTSSRRSRQASVTEPSSRWKTGLGK